MSPLFAIFQWHLFLAPYKSKQGQIHAETSRDGHIQALPVRLPTIQNIPSTKKTFRS